MTFQTKYLLLMLLLPFFGCAEISKADQLNAKVMNANSADGKSNGKIDGDKKRNNLYVFVGEKVSVEQFDPRTKDNDLPFDQAFKAKYKVLQKIYGDYRKDTIEFEAFDHYGTPPFAKYKTVLMFVSEREGKLYHEKYQYFDVNKTKDGRWAHCGDPYLSDEYHRKDFKPAKLEFDEPLLFDLKEFNAEYVKAVFKKPYFKVDENKAECLLGAYVEDLFLVKKEGVLKARGLF